MKRPHEVIVRPFNAQTGEVAHLPCQSLSSLFRKASELHNSVPQAVQAYREHSIKRAFTTLSIGASFGPELDSIMAILNKHDVSGAVIQGVDEQPGVIEAARGGAYIVDNDIHSFPPLRWYVNRKLRALGFEADVQKQRDRTIITTDRVRQSHAVDVWAQDILEQDAKLPAGNDLVACSNTLPHMYWHDPKSADFGLQAAVEAVRPGGILSIGCERDFFADTDTWGDYGQWHQNSVKTLAEHNFTPTVANELGHAVVLQKSLNIR